MQIISAYYGAYNIKAKDVTVQVTKIVQNAAGTQVKFFVGFETFDIPGPAPGIRKSLTVNYQAGDSGGSLCKSGVDGSTVTLDLQSNHIEIGSATYGTDTIFLDITNRVQVSPQEAHGNATLPMVGNPDFLTAFL